MSPGGAEGIRTPDPKTASLVLSQLSYSPTASATLPGRWEVVKVWRQVAVHPPLGYTASAPRCRDGGTGRRDGLKIHWGSHPVGVRLPLPAPDPQHTRRRAPGGRRGERRKRGREVPRLNTVSSTNSSRSVSWHADLPRAPLLHLRISARSRKFTVSVPGRRGATSRNAWSVMNTGFTGFGGLFWHGASEFVRHRHGERLATPRGH